MEQLVGLQLTRFIGVCNFNVQLLTDLLSYAVHKPYLNQVEMHPYLTQQAFLKFCAQNGVRVTAFSPLGSPSYIELNMDQKLGAGLLAEDAILQISKVHGKSPAQVLLRWAVQRGTSVVTKSSKVPRLVENFSIFDFSLSVEEVC
jgi:D-xylose reductase